ncbi:MAG: hypothetical protein KatS3mg051_0762 [Anaerolineae bacterium]|nr:MAG: hypothetical protein KatS3mg051_0762 [Anaerolineae bacterium]
MALGVLLALVLLIRPVGRYLIVPFGVLFLLSTRAPWRTAVLGGSFALALGLFLLFNRVVFDRLELNGGGSFMLGRPLKLSGLLEADNGPASAELIALESACPEGESLNLCLVKQKGDWPTVRGLYARAYREMLAAHPVEFGRQVFDAFTDYLRQHGLQYSGELLPSDVQCGRRGRANRSPDARIPGKRLDSLRGQRSPGRDVAPHHARHRRGHVPALAR